MNTTGTHDAPGVIDVAAKPTRRSRTAKAIQEMAGRVKMPSQSVEQRNTTGMLAAFAARDQPMYLGTVPANTIEKRRAKTRAARKARRLNR